MRRKWGSWLVRLAIIVAVWPPLLAAAADGLHGIAMHGAPALVPGFPHFPQVNPDAPKGGRLNLGAQGTFDSLNPFIIKGVPAQGLRDYVYESLMARSPDEPFTLYGLIAGTVDVPDDRASITFHLRPEARFSDGQPITAEDVLFSLGVLREKGFPYHRSHYKKVAKAEALGPRTVRLTFDGDGDREMPLIMGLMPVLPRHRFTLDSFERTTLEPPVGSGPYRIAAVDPGRAVTYRRNPDYWARSLNVTRGRFNFDEVRFEYYRDSNSLFEAFTTGAVDARAEDDPGRWAEGYRIPAVEDGRIQKREFATGLPAGFSALVFNSRKPLFADPRVRRALILAFDFAWINRNLYHGLYTRTQSLFPRSALTAAGRPADAAERALLAPFPGAVTDDALEGRLGQPGGDGSGNNRDNLRAASTLLADAGFKLEGETMVHQGTRQLLSFEFLARSRSQERLLLTYAKSLRQLGIALRIRQVDDTQYWSRLKSFDFDMIQWTWGASLSPGNEQLNRWSRAAADTPGSLNYAGVKSAAVDAIIANVLSATDVEQFRSAVRALDRLVMSGDYVVALFHVQRQWITHWRHLKAPATTALFGTDFDTWWQEGQK